MDGQVINQDGHFSAWRDEAECALVVEIKPYMQGAWDGPNEEDIRHPYSDQAQEICQTECAMRLMCLKTALTNPEAQGLRGGYEFDGGTVPVADAREIVQEHNLQISSYQSLGRPRL